MRNTLLFIRSTNILVCLLTVNMKNCLTPKIKNVRSHSSISIEIATPSSSTSPLASYKEVPPPPGFLSPIWQLAVQAVKTEDMIDCCRNFLNWPVNMVYRFLLNWHCTLDVQDIIWCFDFLRNKQSKILQTQVQKNLTLNSVKPVCLPWILEKCQNCDNYWILTK